MRLSHVGLSWIGGVTCASGLGLLGNTFTASWDMARHFGTLPPCPGASIAAVADDERKKAKRAEVSSAHGSSTAEPLSTSTRLGDGASFVITSFAIND